MEKYAFWNNKGGTGKTSLAFQSITIYAEKHPEKRVLVLDLCPQANLSELFLGGLLGDGSHNLSSLQSRTSVQTVGGYFDVRLPSPYTVPPINPSNFLCVPSQYNPSISNNITLLAGDPVLELQSNAIATLANNQIPGQNPWLSVVNWINDFINHVTDDFDIVFIDTNPSFSMYTQIALAATSRLILPIMADDSSRRAIQNVFALVYGVSLPSAMYSNYSFTSKLLNAGQVLPKIHLIPKNRLTQYMGPASAYNSVIESIVNFVGNILNDEPEIFTFSNITDGFVDIRDFQTTGVVAFAEGRPFTSVTPGGHLIGGRKTQVNKDRRKECIDAITPLVNRL